MTEAFLRGCELAFESLGSIESDKLRPFIEPLRKSRLSVANYMLQSAYASAPEVYGEEAISLLASQPERLHSGVSGAPSSAARTLIEKCSPYCSDESFRRIEATLLDYKTPYERSKNGFRRQGYSAYALASALVLNRCHENTRRRLAEWRRKFGAPEDTRPGIRSYDVVSPISTEAAERMSDEQWASGDCKIRDGPRNL